MTVKQDYGPCDECARPSRQPRRRGRCDTCYKRCRRLGIDMGPKRYHRRTAPPLAEKIAARTEVAENGCLIWTGMVAKASGYGYAPIKRGVMRLAHRVAYELANGPIPSGFQVDHECHNQDANCPGGPCMHRRCVNAEHLRAVTPRANTLGSSHTTASRWAARTHCEQGHPFNEANTMWVSRSDQGAKTYRRCRACKNNRRRVPAREVSS